ncbi:putative Ig domain-containing protein [Thalassotalea sp. PLHSN55]|uniref:putative Ig domain-containing protein n=1 Tax=Thalassotalea sp. PLHSN55 TaxID=3435888 RepID=UPI003F82A127
MSNKTRIALVVAAALTTAACGSDTKEVEKIVEVPGPIVDNTQNSAPSISGVVTVATVGTEFTFTPKAVDADEDTLSFSVTGLPAGLAIDAATGVVSGTPEAGTDGSHDVVVSVTDGEATTTMSFALIVNGVQAKTSPTAPALMLSGAEDDDLSITLSATDEDGDVVSVMLDDPSALPSWATYYPDTSIISGTPGFSDATAEDIVLAVTASDGETDVAGTLTISVADTNRAPTAPSNEYCDRVNVVDADTSMAIICKNAMNTSVRDSDSGETITIDNLVITDAEGNAALDGWDYDGQTITASSTAMPFPLYDGEEYAAEAVYTFTFDASDGKDTSTGLSFDFVVRGNSTSSDYDLDNVPNHLDAMPEDSDDFSIDIAARGNENLEANIAKVDSIVEAALSDDSFEPVISKLTSNDGGVCVTIEGYGAPVCQSAGNLGKVKDGTVYGFAGLLDTAAVTENVTNAAIGDNHACWKADGEITCSTFEGTVVTELSGVYTAYTSMPFYNNYVHAVVDGQNNDLYASGSDTFCTAKFGNIPGLSTSGGTSVVCDGEMSGSIEVAPDTIDDMGTIQADDDVYTFNMLVALAVSDNKVCYNLAQYVGTMAGGTYTQSPMCYSYEDGGFVESATVLATSDGFDHETFAHEMTAADAAYSVMDAEGDNICYAENRRNMVFCNNVDIATTGPIEEYTYTDLAVGDAHACGLYSRNVDGETVSMVDCWGDNSYGQTVVPTLVNPTQITSSNDFTCAIDNVIADGEVDSTQIVKCWGAVENTSSFSIGF